jgi:predicted nuclease of predicted toxin-antitoxin system
LRRIISLTKTSFTADEFVRWLADECVDAGLIGFLRVAGHDVTYLAEMAPGMSDSEAIDLANREHRILLTEDKDFGEMVIRWRRSVPSLVLIRIDPALRTLKWSRLDRAIKKFGEEMFGRYLIIDEIRLRVRTLAEP